MITQSGDALDDDPLVTPLSAEQLALLEAIAHPVFATRYHGGDSEWPAWAYVEEQM